MASIVLDGVITEIGDKPLTLLCHKGDVRLEPHVQVEIGAEQTLAREARITADEWQLIRVHPAFAQLFAIVMPDKDLLTLRLHHEGMGVRHLTGLLLMLCELEPGQTPYLRFPESFLHPSAQARLGDLCVFLATRKGKAG